MADNLEVIALQLGRLAADIESEKRTRAESNRLLNEANKLLLEELKGLRSDMNHHFHGDGNNPGIIMRIDRLENQKINQESFKEHEESNIKSFGSYNQKLINLEIKLDDRITAVDNDRKNDKSFNKGAAVVISALVTLFGLALLAVQIFYKP